MNIQGLVRPEIRSLEPYSVPDVTYEIKLDAMENPYDVPPPLKKKIIRQLANTAFNRYPDAQALALRQAIADYVHVPSDSILLGNGSDELILAILLSFGGWGRRMVYPVPTFSIYGILTQVSGGIKREVFLEDDFQLSARKIMKEYPDVVFIAYPNNPTGNCFDHNEIMEIIRTSRGVVVIDEAYFEFSQKTFLPLIKEYENVIILRTFSKAFGLAGLRIGYMVASPVLIREVAKVKLPYNVNTLSQQTAYILLKNVRMVNKFVGQIKSERLRLVKELASMVRTFPSETNFIFFQHERAHELCAYLLKKKILIRNFSESYLKDYARVTVGTPQENKKFLMEMKKFFRGE